MGEDRPTGTHFLLPAHRVALPPRAATVLVSEVGRECLERFDSLTQDDQARFLASLDAEHRAVFIALAVENWTVTELREQWGWPITPEMARSVVWTTLLLLRSWTGIIEKDVRGVERAVLWTGTTANRGDAIMRLLAGPHETRELETFVQWICNVSPGFDTMLWELIRVGDDTQLQRIAKGFPKEVEIWERWRSRGLRRQLVEIVGQENSRWVRLPHLPPVYTWGWRRAWEVVRHRTQQKITGVDPTYVWGTRRDPA